MMRARRTGLTILLLAAFAFAPARAQPGVMRERTFERAQGVIARAANGNMLIDATARRGYQAVIATETTLIEYDLDRLDRTRALQMPPLQVAQTTKGEAEWLWTLDESRHRLWAFAEGAPDERTGIEAYRLMSIDLREMRLEQAMNPWPLSERIPLALSYHAPSGRLYVLTRLKVDADGRTAYFVEQRAMDGTLEWEYRVASCFGAMDNQFPPTLARSVLRPAIYLNCYNAGGIQGLVVRLTLDAAGLVTDEESFPAVPGDLSTLFDPGSDRMFFLTTNSGAGRGAWVFDGLRSTFLGVIATADDRPGAFEYAMGLDPRTGRLYMQTPVGLVLADARRTPLPAGFIFREYAASGIGGIAVDPVAHRFFVADATAVNTAGHPSRYIVYRDAIAGAQDPPAGDPDALTIDIDEQPDVTGSILAGGARAYGVRTLTTGGVQRAAWNIALGRFSPDNLKPAWNAIQAAPLQVGNRDLFAARVRGVSVTNDGADAAAIAADTEQQTRKDLADHGAPWPVDAVECHGTGAAADPRTETVADCDASTARAVAQAAYSVVDVPSAATLVRASVAYARGETFRDEDRGLVSTSSAVVRDVTIGARIRIGQVRADAEAWAHGRPGTAGARFTRAVNDVRIDTDGDGSIDVSCDAVCDTEAVAAAADRALAGVARISFPSPDPAFYPHGSRRGYQAVVAKERFRGLAERTLNDDDTTEVPALQIVVFSDGRAGRTREVIQLAAVQAEARYGIYLLPYDEPRPCLHLEASGCGYEVGRPPRVHPPAPRVLGEQIAGPRTIVETVARRVRDGLSVGVFGVTQAGLLALMWGFFGLPVVLAGRRRALRRLRG